MTSPPPTATLDPAGAPAVAPTCALTAASTGTWHDADDLRWAVRR